MAQNATQPTRQSGIPEELEAMTVCTCRQVQTDRQTENTVHTETKQDAAKNRRSYCTCESEISEGFSVRLLLSAGIRSLYFVLTSSSE